MHCINVEIFFPTVIKKGIDDDDDEYSMHSHNTWNRLKFENNILKFYDPLDFIITPEKSVRLHKSTFSDVATKALMFNILNTTRGITS